MKKEECFQVIPCNVAQQTIRMVQKVYKSFFKLIKAKEEGKIPKEQKVNEPSYLNKTKGRYVAQYTPRVISKKHFQKRGVVKLSQIDIEVKTKIKRYEDIALVRVVPKNDEYYTPQIQVKALDMLQKQMGLQKAVMENTNNIIVTIDEVPSDEGTVEKDT